MFHCKWTRISFRVLLALSCLMSALGLEPVRALYAASGDEAPDSTITLQMPFLAGESWTVGGGGFFYGEGGHTNPHNDYYATDWNRGTNDFGAAVLPVADGYVSFADTSCTGDYGCYVQIDHADGYRTVYAHLSAILVSEGSTVRTSTLIGRVGHSGQAEGDHLHLRFLRWVNGTYYSHCNTPVTPEGKCPNNKDDPMWPQGHKPSPMMTATGPTTLTDGGTYTSVNGRVYLPDLRNKDGWNAHFYVRNNGVEQRNVTIYYFYTNGTPTPKVSDVCTLNPNQWCLIRVNEYNRIPLGYHGQAYIDGAENLGIAVIRYRSAPVVTAAYSVGRDAAISPSTTVYVPLVQRANNGNYNDLIIMNTGSSAVSPTVYFQRLNGSTDICPQTLASIPPNGSATLGTLNISCLGTFVGSARITGSQLLAVVSTQWKDYTGDGAADSLMDDEGVSVLAGTTYFPLLQRGNAGRDSGIALQNPNGSSASVTVSYYNQSGGSCGSTGLTILINSMRVIFPVPVTCAQPFVGNGLAVSSQLLGGIVNHILGSDRDAMSHSLLGGNTNTLSIPYAMKNYSYLSRNGWYTGLSIQNTSTSTANTMVFLFDNWGNLVHVTSSFPIAPYGSYIVFPLPGVSDGFFGSAFVQADQNISVSVTNEPSPTANEDTMFAYPGINR